MPNLHRSPNPMQTNLEKYRNDLEALIEQGEQLLKAMYFECHPERFRKAWDKSKRDKTFDEYTNNLPSFKAKYQNWYSQSLALIKQLIPDRLPDFVKCYQPQLNRKELNASNYVLEDYLCGMTLAHGVTRDLIVEPRHAIPRFDLQANIVKSIKARFDSSLFDIRQIVQADLFDSELDAAAELKKKGFLRAAGAIAGVVLEKHLEQVCTNHNVTVSKKDPTISDLNDLLKKADVIDVPSWRHTQLLADLRNLCDHNKKQEPTPENITDLISGVAKISKTVF